MTRRITCYVVFVTLLWGAHTDDEEKVRDMFKSTMTRNDFSNLLQSLIKLNEQRVSVLQKLYRLEDYGVLSEVLRSSDKKTGNGNPNNLFLIVMSKNENDPSRRKIGFQLVDLVSSLNAGSKNNHPKLDFVLDPAGYFTQNIRKEERLESIFGNLSRARPTKKHRADGGSKKISTTKKPLKFNKPGLRAKVKHDSNVSRAATSLKANKDRKYHKENSRYEIVNNKGGRLNANKKLLGYDDNSKHPQTVGYNSQSNEYVEIDFTIDNEKLTTKPNNIKQIITSNHQNSKYSSRDKDEDNYGSPFSHIENDQNIQYTKLSDISTKKYHDINHDNPKTNKYTSKVKVQSNQQKHKLKIKPIIIKDRLSSNYKNTKNSLEGFPFSHIENDHNRQYTKIIIDNSIKKQHGNNHKINKYTPKVKVQSKQQNDKLATKPITIKDIITSNRQNTKYPLEGKYALDENAYGSPFSNIKNDHDRQYTKLIKDISIKKYHDNNHKTNKYTPNVKVQSQQQNDKLTTKPITIMYLITVKNTQKVNIQRNQQPKLDQNKSNQNNQGNKYSKIKTAVKTSTTKNDYRINGTVNKTSENNQGIENSNLNNDNTHANNDDLTYTSIKDEYATKDTKLPSLASENVYGSKPVVPEITKYTQYGSYPDFEVHKDIRDNFNKVMPVTVKELHHRDNPNVKSKKDTDYYGVKMFDNGKSGEEFSVFITNVGNGTAEEVKQQNDPKLTINAFDEPRSKHIARKPFVKCLNKKALKLCCKSCISAYKNVCRKLKCTLRSKKALKSECKRSCQKTFASSSSKYSDENKESSGDENSDESDSDYS